MSILISWEMAEGHHFWLSTLLLKIKVYHSKCASLDAFRDCWHFLGKNLGKIRNARSVSLLSSTCSWDVQECTTSNEQKMPICGLKSSLYITLPLFIKGKSHFSKSSEFTKMIKYQTKSNLYFMLVRKIIYYLLKFPKMKTFCKFLYKKVQKNFIDKSNDKYHG